MTGWLLVSLVLAVLTVRSRPCAAIRCPGHPTTPTVTGPESPAQDPSRN